VIGAQEFASTRVLVTGAGSGIGRAITLAFAAEGADLVLVDIDADGLDRVVAEAHGAQVDGVGSVRGELVDVSDELAVGRLRDRLADRRVDVLVNQAGIIRRGDVVTQELAQWEQVQRTNVSSMFLMCRAILPGMLDAGGGVIVNCSSGAAFESGRGLAAYSASKGAVVALTRSLAVDHGPSVRVNAVCPGLIDTPGAYVDADDRMRHDRLAAAERTPLGRMGRADEVADAVLFLASRRSSFCSGTALMVDGGKLAGA